MSKPLFKEGGPHKIRRTGRDEYSMSIKLPTDKDGMLGRECPSKTCSPAYFKIKPGTGITEGQVSAFCPYCRHSDDSSGFSTREQIRYAEDVMVREAQKEIGKTIESSLGLGPSHRKKLGGDSFSIELSYKQGHLPPVLRPIEEELRRDISCPHCGLEHAVFGLATWCADCGSDIFMTHVEREFSVIKDMLRDVEQRRKEFGARVAARDVENALEDTVSIFEAVLRVLTRRHMTQAGMTEAEIDDFFRRKIRNRYQNIDLSAKLCNKQFGIDLFEGFDENKLEFLKLTYEKRHAITHNLGIIDRMYLDKVRSGELEGHDVPVTAEEVNKAIDLSLRTLIHAHKQLFQ